MQSIHWSAYHLNHATHCRKPSGKTTVIAPLLALRLADGNSLVTQVVPAALCAMARAVMRGRIGGSVFKRKVRTPLSLSLILFARAPTHSLSLIHSLIHSLHTNQVASITFDRYTIAVGENSKSKSNSNSNSNNNDNDSGNSNRNSRSDTSLALLFVARMHARVEAVRREKGVLLTTATTVKSMLLKYLELLSTAGDSRQTPRTRSGALRVADSLAGLLRLFGKECGGVLLLDEVDLLLHPLKSELNFPLGRKQGEEPARSPHSPHSPH